MGSKALRPQTIGAGNRQGLQEPVSGPPTSHGTDEEQAPTEQHPDLLGRVFLGPALSLAPQLHCWVLASAPGP